LQKPHRLARPGQQGLVSGRRSDWLKGLTRILNKIGELDSDEDIDEVEHSVNSYRRFIERNVTTYANEWAKVKQRYLDERQWLLSRAARSTDTIEAAKYLDELYKQVNDWLDKGATLCITDEEYLFLQQTLQEESTYGSARSATLEKGASAEVRLHIVLLRSPGVVGWGRLTLACPDVIRCEQRCYSPTKRPCPRVNNIGTAQLARRDQGEGPADVTFHPARSVIKSLRCRTNRRLLRSFQTG
jgi:hypothetical protein